MITDVLILGELEKMKNLPLKLGQEGKAKLA